MRSVGANDKQHRRSMNTTPPNVLIVPEAFDASDGAKTPFGQRWGGEVIHLSADHLAASRAGQTLAVDVRSEYVVFLKAEKSESDI